MKSTKQGRPSDNITPILSYTQNFQDHNGITYKWVWDKNISKGSPLFVEIHDPVYNKSDRLIKQLQELENKYNPKNQERKPRITKADKELMESLQYQLEEEHYNHFPEDRPQIKTRKNAKN